MIVLVDWLIGWLVGWLTDPNVTDPDTGPHVMGMVVCKVSQAAGRPDICLSRSLCHLQPLAPI